MAKAKSTTKNTTKRPAAAKEAVEHTTTRTTRVSGGNRFKGELVLGALFAELVGTFVLTAVALSVAGNPIVVAVAVIILVMAMSRLSGGHVNPAVTLGMLATKQISAVKAIGYVVAQILGAMLAYVIVNQFVHSAPVDATTAQPQTMFAVSQLVGQWRPFFAEALGGLVFGVGVAAAIIGRKNSHESGFIIGGSLLLGLVIATLGSSAIVNPAVAIGLSAYQFSNGWSLLAYAVGPVVGVIAGAWLYKLLQWDVTGKKELEA